MKKYLLSFVFLVALPIGIYAAVDTFEGSAFTTSNTVEGSTGQDTIEGSTIKAAAAGGTGWTDNFDTTPVGRYTTDGTVSHRNSEAFELDGSYVYAFLTSGNTLDTADEYFCWYMFDTYVAGSSVGLRFQGTGTDHYYYSMRFDSSGNADLYVSDVTSGTVNHNGSSFHAGTVAFSFDTGDYSCISVTGTGTSTEFKGWDFGTSAPGSDYDSWGAATWTVNNGNWDGVPSNYANGTGGCIVGTEYDNNRLDSFTCSDTSYNFP